MRMPKSTTKWLLATTVLAGYALSPWPAMAQDAGERIGSIELQIKALQNQLQQLKRDLNKSNAQARAAQEEAARAREEARRAPPPAAPAPAAPPPAAVAATANGETPVTFTTKHGEIRVGGVTIQLGGFIEAAGIFRSRNDVSDVGSNYNAIPFAQSPLYHENETRFSARQSRLSLLVQGRIDPKQLLTAYYETDFLGTGPTSNSNESNSYSLRLRQAFATYDNTDWHLHVLGGQAWSLITPYKMGLVPRQENIPLTIDAQYVPGFSWKRTPQFRVATDLDDGRIWLAASVENPESTYYTGPNGAGTLVGTVNSSNPGIGLLPPNVNYSLEPAPDLIVKAAWEPGFGHYEAYGVARFLRTRVSEVGRGQNNTVLAGGGGIGGIIPVIPKYLDLQGNVLVGNGIGTYGSGQLPDATLSRSGNPDPIPEVEALVGLVGHPNKSVDIYGYVGTEQTSRTSFNVGNKGYGYGSPLYSNAGCNIELSTLPCVGNTSGLVQGTIGTWWRAYQGSFGALQLGAQVLLY